MRNLILKIGGTYLNVVCRLFPAYGGQLGFNLFCTPYGGRLKEYQSKYLDRAEKFLVDFEGFQLQGYKIGNGPIKIGLFHGWGVNSFRWKSLIDFMDTTKYTIYAMDAPGHGGSGSKINNIPMYSRSIETFINQIGSLDFAIGHSIGGATLVYTAFRNKEINLGKLVIMGAPGAVVDFFNFYKKMAGLSNHTVTLVKKVFEDEIGFNPESFSVKNFGKHIERETLIIHDKEDHECPYKNAVMLSQEMPNAKLLSTTGLGHSLKSKNVYEEILTFCSTEIHKSDYII
jgi:esterase/lipase